jgi:DNA-binding NarL/FixJ family response regulator
MGFTILVLEADSGIAESLATETSSVVHAVRTAFELREQVIMHLPDVVILDLECARLSNVISLHRDFPSLPIVCTHRVPDEELWIAALEAGAADVCRSEDVQNVLTSVLRSVEFAQHAA